MSDSKEESQSGSRVENSVSRNSDPGSVTEALDFFKKQQQGRTRSPDEEKDEKKKVKKQQSGLGTISSPSVRDFIAGFINLEASTPSVLEDKKNNTQNSPSTPISPLSPDDIVDVDINSPLLGKEKQDGGDEKKSASSSSPQTPLEIRQLSVPQIKELLDDAVLAVEEAKTPKTSKKAKAKLGFLLLLCWGAISLEPTYSAFLRKNINDNLDFWGTLGHTKTLTAGIADSDAGTSWVEGVANLLVDMLSVNAVQEAFEFFSNKINLRELIQTIRENKLHSFFKGFNFALFLGVSAILASADATGLKDLTKEDNLVFAIITGIVILVEGLAYYGMFSSGQLVKHTDALYKSIASYLKKSETADDTQNSENSDISFTELGERLAVFLESVRIVLSNWLYRGLSTLYILEQTLTVVLKLELSKVTIENLLITTGIAGLYVAAMTRTLQTMESFYNPKFDTLTQEQIQEAKVGKLQRTVDIVMTAASGLSMGKLVSSALNNSTTGIGLGTGVGIGFAMTTWYGSNYRSTREAALAALDPPDNDLADKYRLHTVLLMKPEEVFDEIVIKLKSNKWMMRVAEGVNDFARLARILMSGGFITNFSDFLNGYGFGINLSFWDQVALTLAFTLPVQVADAKVFKRELIGKDNDAGGVIPYLVAKYKIGSSFRDFLTKPKENYDFIQLLKILFSLDENLKKRFEDFKELAGNSVPDLKEEGNQVKFILNLQAKMRAEYTASIERTAKLIPYHSDFISNNILKKHPELKPIIEKLKKGDFNLGAKDFPLLKDLESRLARKQLKDILKNNTWVKDVLADRNSESTSTSGATDKDEKYLFNGDDNKPPADGDGQPETALRVITPEVITALRQLQLEEEEGLTPSEYTLSLSSIALIEHYLAEHATPTSTVDMDNKLHLSSNPRSSSYPSFLAAPVPARKVKTEEDLEAPLTQQAEEPPEKASCPTCIIL